MADISTWSPVDESNTAAPPSGWPEFMAVSGVNNTGRAMMGAIRRWYDQLLAGTLVLPYLPLSGGTLTGTLYGPYFHSTDRIDAEGQITGNSLVTSAAITAGGNIHAEGSVSANTNITSAGNISANNNLIAGNDVIATSNISGNIVTANQVTSNGNASVAGMLTTAAITSTGNILGNVITGQAVNSNGNMGIAGNVNIAGSLQAAGAVIATSFVDSDGLLLHDIIAELTARVTALEAIVGRSAAA